MCGIAGFIDFKKKLDLKTLSDLTEVLNHRGPDSSDLTILTNKFANIGLGHKRLSIIDLSDNGHQPMTFRNLSIVYNGEVYNFQEIKKELTDLGYNFYSNSDTEVVLKAFHKWGVKSLDKFIGMFAFAIFDNLNNKFFLIRDRAGIKPLYWYYNNELLLFASELKSFNNVINFKKELDLNSASLFFKYGYIPQPYTIFKKTFKLNSGNYLEVNLKNKKITKTTYWDVSDFYKKKKLNISENEILAHTENLLKSAFEYRMVSDVPVGIFLSGGYDSSAVTAILQKSRTKKLKTFSIGFKESHFNEAQHAKKVAQYLGTEHYEYFFSSADALNLIPKISENWDEPFGDSSCLPTMFLSKKTRDKVKVSLSADGGDEIFGGYTKYIYSLTYYNNLKLIPFKNQIANLISYIQLNNTPFLSKNLRFLGKYYRLIDLLNTNNAFEIMDIISQKNTHQEINMLLQKPTSLLSTDFNNTLNFSDHINQMLNIDYKTYLADDILTKIDRSTMAFSLEGREPLLDHRIIEFLARIPGAYKIINKETKPILKKIVHKYIPKKLMDRPKMGFGIPMNLWLKNEFKDYLLHYTSRNQIKSDQILNYDTVKNLKEEYLKGDNTKTTKLWYILIFQLWKEKWM